MAKRKTKREKEIITKEVINQLKKSVQHLQGASIEMRKMDIDKQKLKKDIDYLGYAGADIEGMIDEYLRILQKEHKTTTH